MSETRRFISLVEQYECLWKESLRNSVESRRQAWEDVGEKMYGQNWRTFSAADKAVAKQELKKKWKNIKDCLNKELKRQRNEKTGISNKKKSKYMFFDCLMFLLPEIDIKSRYRFPIASNDTDTYSNGGEQESFKDDNSYGGYSYETGCDSPSPPKAEEQESTCIVPRSVSMVRRKPIKPKLSSVQFRSRLLKILSQQKNEKQNCSHDDDESFFHSLLPLVRKLDEQQKLQFRMEVLNSLRNIRNFNNISQQTMNMGNMSNSQSYFPVTQHQLQIYSLPSTHTEISTTNDVHAQHNSNVVNVSASSQLEHVSMANELAGRKSQDVQVFPNVL